MAALQQYAIPRGAQDANPQQVWRAYDRVIENQYPGPEMMNGAQFWGTSIFDTSGLHHEVLMHTRLLGTAPNLGRDTRTVVPEATYATVDWVGVTYFMLGISYGYFEEELEDMLYPAIVTDRLGDLAEVLADGEETEFYVPYNNGETVTGGWTGLRLFCDGGATHFLQIIGDQGVNYGSNIIGDAGGPSFHLISLLEQYGENFISEEGRPRTLRVDRIMASPQNAKLLALYYGATSNIEAGDGPNGIGPLHGYAGPEGTPLILSTQRLANSNNMIVFYEGWEQDLQEISKYRGRANTEMIGTHNQKKLLSMLRSRFGFYWFNNRRVVLVKGAA